MTDNKKIDHAVRYLPYLRIKTERYSCGLIKICNNVIKRYGILPTTDRRVNS